MALRSSAALSNGPALPAADWTDEFIGVDVSLLPQDSTIGISRASSAGVETLVLGPGKIDVSEDLGLPDSLGASDGMGRDGATEATSALQHLAPARSDIADAGGQGGSTGSNSTGADAMHTDTSRPVPGGPILEGEAHIIGATDDGLGPIYALPTVVTGGIHPSPTHSASTSYYDPSAIPYVGGTGDDVLAADDRSSILLGGGGNDTLTGGAARDILYGNAGNDRIEGRGGDDLLAGGPGTDTFVFKESWGADILFDFEDAQDIIAFSKSVFADFADLQTHMRQVGEDVVVQFEDSNVLTIKHATLGQLGSDDFSFF